MFHAHFAREGKQAQRAYAACLEHVCLEAVAEGECYPCHRLLLCSLSGRAACLCPLCPPLSFTSPLLSFATILPTIISLQ